MKKYIKRCEILATGEKIDGVSSRNQLTEFFCRSLLRFFVSLPLFGPALISFSADVSLIKLEREQKGCLQARFTSGCSNKKRCILKESCI